MLDLHSLHEQFDDFNVYQSREHERTARQVADALEALEGCSGDWEQVNEDVRGAQLSWLVAHLREAPDGCHTCGDRPTPITVVATDGSQVYPDRHFEPSCYLLNVSRIAFHYGTTERPLMEAVPALRYRQDELDGAFDELLATASADVVSAFRDELELKELLRVAEESRMPGRPLVALADGTLIRWMLRRMNNRALEEALITRYAETLEAFRERRIPLCSYISMPGNTELVNVLRFYRGERPNVPTDDTLEGLVDRKVFERTLAPGERSAIFESSSHIQAAYGPADRICYFYVHVPTAAGPEIGRVEVPHWLADDPALVALVHAVIVSECEKGEGYPMVLSEAHERAVIRAHERELFYELIEQQMTEAGLPVNGSRKQASKRKPMV